MKPLFNDFMENEAPVQLKVLFNELNDEQGIMLQECFHFFAKKAMNQWNTFDKYPDENRYIAVKYKGVIYAYKWKYDFYISNIQSSMKWKYIDY
jgi:hypothetical protein